MKKDIEKRCGPHCKLRPQESLIVEYEQVRYWKFVANGKCSAEIGELSSVKNLFWANHASKKREVILNGK